MPENNWSEVELWAWEEIRAGRVADFNVREGRRDTPLEPKAPGDWGDGRRLGAGFLREILFREPHCDAIPVEGVRIVGAWFLEPVDLSHGRLDRQLWLQRCRFEATVDLTRLRVDGSLSLAGSAFAAQGAAPVSVDLTAVKISEELHLRGAMVTGTLGMNGLAVGRNLFMGGPNARFKNVDLQGAKVGGMLALDGARVEGALNMSSLVVEGRLHMGGLEVERYLIAVDANAQFQDVDLHGAKIGGQLTLGGAKVEGALNMNSLAVGESLLMHAAHFRDVLLTNAQVTGQLALVHSIVEGALNMNGLVVGQHLIMRHVRIIDPQASGIAPEARDSSLQGQSPIPVGATLQNVALTNARVTGQLDLLGATLECALDMNGLVVGQHLLMHAAHFRDVLLTNAQVTGQLALVHSIVQGALDMNSLTVGRDLIMCGARFDQPISLIFARTGSALDLSGAEVGDLDLSAARITGELRLGSAHNPRTKWRNGACLTLRNAYAGALLDRRDRVTDPESSREQWEDAWPDELQLNGFTYDRLGGFGGTAAVGSTRGHRIDTDLSARDISWFIEWLAHSGPYAPQPYEQLAAAFRAAGDPVKANRILYESRERERRQSTWPRWLWLGALKATIGYGLGLRHFRALLWVVVFWVVGTYLLDHFCQPPAGLPAKIVYSLDQLLPIVEFEKYDDVVLTGVVAYYFYAQKLIGWALGSFLIAGLAGLTQK